MAEAEQRARLDSVKKDSEAKARLLEIADSESNSNQKMTTRGQWIGAAVTFLCIFAAAFFAWLGKSDTIVVCFLAVPTASLIAAFFPRGKGTKTKNSYGRLRAAFFICTDSLADAGFFLWV